MDDKRSVSPALVALDPGARVGAALLSAGGELLDLATFSWARQRDALLWWVNEQMILGATVAVVEIPGEGVRPRPGLSRRAMLKVACGVGKNQERADALARHCEQVGLRVVRRAPVRRGTKLPRRTWDAIFPGWAGRRVSGHARDAAVLGKCSLGSAGHG